MISKLLITGGAGFIGSEFVRKAVSKGYEVAVIDNLSYAGDMQRLKEVTGRIKFFKTDITDREAVKGIFESVTPEAVVHWAAESHVDRSILDASPFLNTNIFVLL